MEEDVIHRLACISTTPWPSLEVRVRVGGGIPPERRQIRYVIPQRNRTIIYFEESKVASNSSHGDFGGEESRRRFADDTAPGKKP